jgi:hypothetical protein
MSLAPGERRACHACGVAIIGARSASNRANVMPVVVEPHPKGNVLIQQQDGELVGFVFGAGIALDALREKGVAMRVNHFADCSGAAQFRRGGQDAAA